MLRQRYHHFALAVNNTTGLRYRHSALELAVEVWNRLTDVVVAGNSGNIKSRLEKDAYVDLLWTDCLAMTQSLLVL